MRAVDAQMKLVAAERAAMMKLEVRVALDVAMNRFGLRRNSKDERGRAAARAVSWPQPLDDSLGDLPWVIPLLIVELPLAASAQ